jgi:NAD(P)H-dependent FMN reductase
MNQDKNVLVIMGSVRAGRVCPTICDWITQIGMTRTSFQYENIDLSRWTLPMDDEPAIPATGSYAQVHTQAWSEKISSADGVIFVTPQYNWGYPAVLKNAIDHLYREWFDKPAMIVTYGGHGGTKCSEQLKQVISAVKMRLVSITPALELSNSVIREGAAVVPHRDFNQHVASVEKAFAELSNLITKNN